MVNVAETRQILGYIHRKEWFDQTDEEKKLFKDSVIAYNCIDSNFRVYITTGKKNSI